MTSPSPFDVSRAVGTNIYQAKQQARDENAIERILAQSSQSQDPNAIQDSIGKILSQVSPERQGAALQYLQNAYSNVQKKQEEQKRKNASTQVGLNPDLPEALQKVQYENQLLDQRAKNVIGGSPTTNNQMPQANTQQNEPVNWRGLSDDQLVQLSGIKGFAESAKQELKRRQEDRTINQRKDEHRIKFGQDIGKKVLERADEIAEAIPQKQSALSSMMDAIAGKNLSFFSWDNLAELTGIEALRSPEGALFKTAAKEYFLGNIARAGARPNQWIEQQIADMMTKIGRSTEANLSVARALQNELGIEKERVRLTREISDQIDAGDGDYRKLGSMVNEQLSKYAEQKQNELYNDLRAIKSIGEDKPQKFHKVKSGTQISPYMVDALLILFNNDDVKALEEAKKLGYSVE